MKFQIKLSIALSLIVLIFALVPGDTSASGPNTFTFTTIDVPGSIETVAIDMNQKGEIVGWYQTPDAKAHGFLLSGGSFTTIDFPGAATTIVGGINNQGQITGYYEPVHGEQHGFLLNNGSFTTI